MEPERALALSAAQLKSGLTPAEIARRVQMRYPEAQPLPSRPKLDELLRPHGLSFDDGTGAYARAGSPDRTMMATRIPSVLRAQTALPSQALSMEPDAVSARQFDEKLRNAVERRAFRVLGVRADRARQAALAIAQRIGTVPLPFDQLLTAAIREQMRQGGVRGEDLIHLADREGRVGASWPNLLRLVRGAADAVAASLLEPKEPLLLVQPGLIARYRLDGFLRKLIEASKAPDTASIFLLVPSHDMGGIPLINGDLSIPGVLASQVLWVSLDWLANKHNRAA
jgi:hypothetical protein